MSRAVLITRPEPGLADTASAITALGWQPVPAPGLVLHARPFRPVRTQAALLTSRAAARALPPLPIPVFAVGEATAKEARARGQGQVIAAEGDAAALATLVRARLDPTAGPLLLAIGQGYAQDLSAALRQSGFRVLRRVVYVARPVASLPEAARDALLAGTIGQALFFSPRSAQVAIALLRQAGLAARLRGIRALAISARVAEVLAALPWGSVAVAARPDHAAMMQLLGAPPCPSPP
ncbi:MAG: uroporphyrinogen-III synthase [Alphaproteobacteria bacterium]|jgi:uroporphyrinogen-III synthase|nr:uroporphyrinogen-III synthase [Alphaproteobacteria bacterium]